MSTPKLRTSPARKNKRRSHLAISPTKSVICPNCGASRKPHHACTECGYVRPGLQIKTNGNG